PARLAVRRVVLRRHVVQMPVVAEVVHGVAVAAQPVPQDEQRAGQLPLRATPDPGGVLRRGHQQLPVARTGSGERSSGAIGYGTIATYLSTVGNSTPIEVISRVRR